MSTSGLDVDFTYRFEAAHRLTSSASVKCQTPHGHTWWVKATFSLDPQLRSLGPTAMGAEFSLIKKSLKQFIDETADHSFFVNGQDPVYRISREHVPGLRALEFPCDPTTEAIAAAFALKMTVMHQALASPAREQMQLTALRIQETPTNAVEIRREFAGHFPLWISDLLGGFDGWWSQLDPLDRSPISQRKEKL